MRSSQFNLELVANLVAEHAKLHCQMLLLSVKEIANKYKLQTTWRQHVWRLICN